MTAPFDELTRRAAKVRAEIGRGRTETEDAYFLGLAHGLEEARDFMLRARTDEDAAR